MESLSRCSMQTTGGGSGLAQPRH